MIAKLGLNEPEAGRNSPGPTQKPLVLAYGADELPALRKQSEDYARRLGREAMAPITITSPSWRRSLRRRAPSPAS